MPSSTLADTASLTMTTIRHNGDSNGSNTVGTSLNNTLSNGPQRFPYLFRNIRDFPRRVFHPPKPSVPLVGTVRSLKLTPCYRVSLENVINGRHLPPLGRKEFEDFLYFKELSVENLYFHVWLLNYQTEWIQWANSNGIDLNSISNKGSYDGEPPKPNAKLSMSYARAKETFFTSGSPWELNLPQRTLQQLLHPQTPHPGPKSHPHPIALSAVRFEINAYLNDSLTRFIVQYGGNAGRHRGLFAVTLGLIVVGVGLIPIVLNSLTHDHTWHQKLMRLSSIPALWFGFATLIAGLHGVCVLIFLFGDARQLYPYELRRPNISSPITCSPSLTLNPNLAANAAEHRKQQLPNRNSPGVTNTELSNHRPTLAASSLDNVGVSRGRRASTVSVTISPQKERFGRIEFVHLPGGGHHRTDTVAASEASTTCSPSEGHADHRHRNSVSKADYESIGNLNFGLYEGEDHSTKKGEYTERAMPVDDLEAQSATEMFPQHGGSWYTPTTATYSTPLHPDLPIAFDFDALPVPPTMHVPDWKTSNPASPAGDTRLPVSLTSSRTTAPLSSLPYDTRNAYGSSTFTNVKTGGSQTSRSTLRRKFEAVKSWEWNKERTVFAPLTKVLDPVITRSQWEIVMRSCLVALAISLVIGLSSLGLP